MSTARTLSGTTVSTLVYGLLVVMLVTSVAGTALGAAPITSSDARIVIDQPHYIDSEVKEQSQNGTSVYVAKGAELTLHPQNFDTSRLVDFGVATANGSMTYDSRTDTFVFTPSAKGTFEVYWIVNQQAQQERRSVAEGNNSTGGNTTTSMQQVRYSTRIRVTGGLNLVHRKSGSIKEMRTAAKNWREVNSTLHQRGLVGPEGTGPAVEEMIKWYELHPSNNPFEALTGGVVGYLVIGATSTAILVWVVFFGWHAKAINALRRRLHVLEAVESEEGTAKEALSELDRQQQQREAQNTDWQDLPGFDDHVAKAFRETFGTTVHDGTVSYIAATLPRNLVRDRLQAMGHDGWVAIVTEESATDGGGDELSLADRIGAVKLARRADVNTDDVDEDDVIDLAGADSETIDAVCDALPSFDVEELRLFDLPAADYDAGELNTTYESMDLDSVIDQLQADMRHFDDKQAFGEYLQEFLASVEESPVCDEQGRPDGLRYVMSHFLKHAQVMDDRFNFPLIRFHRESIERALIDFDPEQEATDAIKDIQAGGGG